MNPLVVVFAVLFAIAGYQEARRFARQHGATPWGWDPWVWAVVMLLSWVIGLILLAIAERQGRSRSPRSGVPVWSTPAQPVLYGTTPGGGGGYPIGSGPSASGSGPWMPVATGGSTAVVPGPTALSDGRWADDPSGRHQCRWWNGREWTTDVATNGVRAHDPL